MYFIDIFYANFVLILQVISEKNQTDTVSTCRSSEKSVATVESKSPQNRAFNCDQAANRPASNVNDVLETTREQRALTFSYLVLGKHYFFLSFSTLTSDLYSYIYM